MYRYLSRLLASELEVLSFCLDVKIAEEIELILVKVVQKEISAKTAQAQIQTILKAKNLESENEINTENFKENLGNLENKKIEVEIQAETEIQNQKKMKKSPKNSVENSIKISKNSQNENLEVGNLENDIKKTESESEIENSKNQKPKNEQNFSLDLEAQNPEENLHLATASLRAPVGYHLPNAMKKMDEKNPLLTKFGGHPCAAGFSANAENLDKIKQNLSREIAAQNTGESSQKSFVNKTFKTKIPTFLKTKTAQKNLIWLNLPELNLQFLRDVCQLEPFGQDFAMPNFVFQVPLVNSKLQGKRYFNEFALGRQKKLGPLYFWLGKEQKHIKIEIADLKITVFGIDNFLKEKLNNPQEEIISLWLECRISQNTWQEKTTLELLAQEIWME